mgnify:CR=1 FL=1
MLKFSAFMVASEDLPLKKMEMRNGESWEDGRAITWPSSHPSTRAMSGVQQMETRAPLPYAEPPILSLSDASKITACTSPVFDSNSVCLSADSCVRLNVIRSNLAEKETSFYIRWGIIKIKQHHDTHMKEEEEEEEDDDDDEEEGVY